MKSAVYYSVAGNITKNITIIIIWIFGGGFMRDYNGKRVLVLGLARSGLAAVRLLVKLGASVTVSESKKPEEIKELDELLSMGVRVLGQDKEVFEENYDIAIKNPGINGRLWFVRRLKERNIPVITEIELAFTVSAPQHYIAVTGSNGKTTVSTLLYEVISKAHPDKTHLSGNIGVALCDTVLQNDLLNESGHYIVLEISNFQLVDIDKFRPEVAVIINLAADHLDFMGTEDAYYRSKCRVYENMSGDDVFLSNIDDPLVGEYTALLPVKCRKITYSLENSKADFYADNEFIYAYGKKLFPISSVKVVGRHNVQNVLVACAAASAEGLSAEQIKNGVEQFKGVEHRIEFVREYNGVRYYNDSKGTNVDATKTALKAFSSPVILLAGGHEKGLSLEPLKECMSGVKKIIAYGECGKRICDELAEEKGELVKTLPEALQKAVASAVPGDVVLLSPTTSSYDQYTCFEERGEHFKKLVNALGE